MTTTETPTEMTWDERVEVRRFGHLMRLLGVPGRSDAELATYTPREIAMRAGYEDPDEAASEFVAGLLENYISDGRPDAYALAEGAIYSVGYLQDVVEVLASFSGSWGCEPIGEVLGWCESDETGDESVGDVMTATFFKVALDLAGAILALDGRLSTGEDA